MSFTIHYQPKHLTYRLFSQVNDLCFADEPISEYEFHSMMAGDFWCIYSDKTLAGYGILNVSQITAHIKRMAVHPDYRSQGLGSRLMEIMLGHCSAKKVNRIDLLVEQDNLAAINLYKRFGFSIIEECVQFEVDICGEKNQTTFVLPISAYEAKNHGPLPHRVVQWEQSHDPPHIYILLFVRDNMIVGFTRFNPHYPGCSPFKIFNEGEDIAAIISLLDEFVLPQQKRIKVTTGNKIAINYFFEKNYKENYKLFVMTRELPGGENRCQTNH